MPVVWHAQRPVCVYIDFRFTGINTLSTSTKQVDFTYVPAMVDLGSS